MKSIGMLLLLIGLSSFAFGGINVTAPEISPVAGVGAITLLSGAILVIRARRKH